MRTTIYLPDDLAKQIEAKLAQSGEDKTISSVRLL